MMGVGEHGGFGSTKGSTSSSPAEKLQPVKLPSNPSQLKHIFSDREGHLPDTPANRERLLSLANDSDSFKGVDRYGNNWHIHTTPEGEQLWSRSKDGTLNEGGLNKKPRPWNSDTGLNRPARQNRKKAFNKKGDV